MKHIPNMMLTYTYEQITYCVRLIKLISGTTWEVVVEGLIAPRKKLPAFTKKYSILQPGTILQANEKNLLLEQRVIGLVVDHIGYIDWQIYLHDEDKQLEEVKKWKQYRFQFLPAVVTGGVA